MGDQSRAGVVHNAAVCGLGEWVSVEEDGTEEHDGRPRGLDHHRMFRVLADCPERADLRVHCVHAHHGRAARPVAWGRDVRAGGNGTEHGGHGTGKCGAEEGFVSGAVGG